MKKIKEYFMKIFLRFYWKSDSGLYSGISEE